MNDLPTTSQVLSIIKSAGVIVGSWPRKRDEAKDIDVVIVDRHHDARNPVFAKLLAKFGDTFESSGPGHGFVRAIPMNIEIFESKTGWRIGDPDKDAKQLTYHQAKRRASWIDCYGIVMRAVA